MMTRERPARPFVPGGRVIQNYRKQRKLTQSELAQRCDIPLSMIKEYEQGRAVPPGDRLAAIIHECRIPASAMAEIREGQGR
jgi:transcriptional regulator with XRE-family HTH domain